MLPEVRGKVRAIYDSLLATPLIMMLMMKKFTMSIIVMAHGGTAMYFCILSPKPKVKEE